MHKRWVEIMHIGEYTTLGTFFTGILALIFKVNKDNKAKVSARSFNEFKKEVKEERVHTKLCDLNIKHHKESLDRLERGQERIFDKLNEIAEKNRGRKKDGG